MPSGPYFLESLPSPTVFEGGKRTLPFPQRRRCNVSRTVTTLSKEFSTFLQFQVYCALKTDSSPRIENSYFNIILSKSCFEHGVVDTYCLVTQSHMRHRHVILVSNYTEMFLLFLPPTHTHAHTCTQHTRK